MSSNPDSPSTATAEQPKNGTSKRFLADHPWLPFIGAAAVGIILFLGLGYLARAFSHESTDDAFIESDIVSVAPKISGQVAAVNVRDNQTVRKGDLLIEINADDYNAKLAQKQASSETSKANLKAVLSLLQLMDAKMDTATGGARQAHAQTDAAAATAKRAQSELERFQELIKSNAVSQQEFENVQAAATEAAANLKAVEQAAVQADSRVDESKAQLNAASSAVDLARAQIKQSDADQQSAALDVSYTKIYAPVDGRVTRKSVEVGNYLQIGQPLLTLVSPDLWVVANFKETQLTHMRTNQPVDITIEASDQPHLRGHVESFQAGSGARFSLLPPENAVGNFVKVVQRVPVKIVFDEAPQSQLIIGPGMSVVPTVTVGAEFPEWAVALIAIVLAFGALVVFKALQARGKPNPAAA